MRRLHPGAQRGALVLAILLGLAGLLLWSALGQPPAAERTAAGPSAQTPAAILTAVASDRPTDESPTRPAAQEAEAVVALGFLGGIERVLAWRWRPGEQTSRLTSGDPFGGDLSLTVPGQAQFAATFLEHPARGDVVVAPHVDRPPHGQLWHTEDGRSLQPLGPPAGHLLSALAVDADGAVLAAADGAGVLRFDGSWRLLQGSPPDAVYVARSDEYIWAIGSRSGLHRLEADGRWSALGVGASQAAVSRPLMAQHASRPAWLLMARAAELWASLDRGATWSTVAWPHGWVQALEQDDRHGVLALTAEALYRPDGDLGRWRQHRRLSLRGPALSLHSAPDHLLIGSREGTLQSVKQKD